MLKTYKSHKEVKAEPMMFSEAYRRKLIRDASTEEGSDTEGYYILYRDGYESWSPKKEFEDGYTEVPSNYKEKLVLEHKQLYELISKLKIIINTPSIFDNLEISHRILFNQQKAAMTEYYRVLNKRIQLKEGI